MPKYVVVPSELPSDPGPNYTAGLYSRRNWEAAIGDLEAASPAPAAGGLEERR